MGGLSENIRKYRLKADLKQEELAFMLGKSKNVISNWERGDNRPDSDMVEKLCRILNTTPNELYGWEAQEEEPHTIAAHFDGEDFTHAEMEEILRFAEFVKNKRR